MSHMETLIDMLHSQDALRRYAACEQLRVSGRIPNEAISALRQAMRDPDTKVADAATRALAIHAPSLLPAPLPPPASPPSTQHAFQADDQAPSAKPIESTSPPSAAWHPSKARTSTHVTCPVCAKDDSIQKVSAVVAAGQSSGTFSGPSGGVAYLGGKWGSVYGYSSLSGFSTTDLARALMRPPEPKSPSGFGLWWVLILLLFAPPALMAIVATLTAFAAIIYPSGFAQSFPAATSLGSLSCVVGIVPLVLLYMADRSKFSREWQKYGIDRPIWERAVDKWARLYFCHRDGTVFDPETREVSDLQSLTQFLYS